MTKQEEIREGLLGYLGCPLENQPYESWNCEHWDEEYGCNCCSIKIPTANYILTYLHSQGVVLLVEREQKYSEQTGAPIKPTKYRILEPLIEEGAISKSSGG